MSRVEATAAAVESRFGARARRVPSLPDEITLEVEPQHLLEVCTALRDAPDLAFEELIDLSGIDYLDFGRSEWATYRSARARSRSTTTTTGPTTR